MEIARQCPTATRVAGLYAWNQLGRKVMKGQKGIRIDDVARRLNVSRDWVWDHSSRKSPQLPVIRMGDGALRYRASRIEAFIDERERLSAMRRLA